ncbi:MAG: NlpC/P60 family protein [Balneolales bacterium]|nr:NlpC/P60 family protein [Balneolales bacterium]
MSGNATLPFYELFVKKFSYILFIILLIAASGCNRQVQTRGPQSNVVEQRLMQQYQQWQGTPYRLGGMNLNGVDCSAFVMMVFKNGFDIDIPRNTAEQMSFGSAVSPRQLMIGDLVFFQTGRNTLHVGIVLRGGDFMHASTSQGVMISHLGESYWRQRFIRARRVM